MEPLGTAASRALSLAQKNELESLEQKLAAAEYLDLATKLLGSRRTGTANDPEIYIAAITRVLSGYPLDVARRVIDPLHGPLATLKWLPEPAEVRAACEELHAPMRYAQEWDARAAQQLAEREEYERLRVAAPANISEPNRAPGRPISAAELGHLTNPRRAQPPVAWEGA